MAHWFSVDTSTSLSWFRVSNRCLKKLLRCAYKHIETSAWWSISLATLRQFPKEAQCNLNTSSCPDANWLSVASAGTLCAHKNLELDAGNSNSTLSPIFSSYFSWQWCQQCSYIKAQTTADTLSERLSPCSPSPSTAVQVRWQSCRQSCTGGYRDDHGVQMTRQLEISYAWVLEFVQGFPLCEKGLLLFSILIQGGFFQKRFTPWISPI